MLKQIKANINASDKKFKLYEIPNLKHDIRFFFVHKQRKRQSSPENRKEKIKKTSKLTNTLKKCFNYMSILHPT